MVFLNNKIGESGFTLIEVLVSMMVMAISLTVIMNLFSGGLRSKKRVQDYNMAVDLAGNKIEEILLEQTLEPGIYEGQFENDYTWTMKIGLGDSGVSDFGIPIEQHPKMYLINMEVKWKHGDREKTYSIQTLQMEESKELPRVHAS